MSILLHGWTQVRGWAVHYAEAGTGPAAIMAPGLGLTTRFYRRVLERFADRGVRLVVPDLPGFGGTRGPRAGTEIGELAGWLLELADALHLRRPAWVGHSLGCQVALELAATFPERAAALVLAAPTGAPVRHRLAGQFFGLIRAGLREPPSTLLAVARDYVRLLPSAYLGTWIRARQDQPVEKLGRIRCPTLILVGARDPVVPRSYAAQLRDGIRGAGLLEVRGGNHALPLDAGEAFASAAGSFLRQVLETD